MRSMSMIIKYICILFIIIPGCYYSKSNSIYHRDYDNFFKKTLSEQHVEIKKLPINDQFEIYIHSMLHIHPPYMGFALDIAQEPDISKAYLKKRLIDEDDENIQQLIIQLFETMTRLECINRNMDDTCINIKYIDEIRDDDQLIDLIKDKIKDMDSDFNKTLSRNSLDKILNYNCDSIKKKQ